MIRSELYCECFIVVIYFWVEFHCRSAHPDGYQHLRAPRALFAPLEAVALLFVMLFFYLPLLVISTSFLFIEI